MSKERQQKRKKLIARFLLLVMLFQIFQPPAFALTSGPSQPEVQSFEPAGTTDMVDLFTGDFTYNIPLFELPGPNGGYPFNLSYHAGIGMDQEASWVGLGWNLNPGAITRQMRGLPDEFKGDSVYTKMSIAPSVTVGLGAGAGVELLGGDLSIGMGLSFYSNNYKGVGYTIDASLGFGNATENGVNGGLGISLDSNEGVGLSPSIGLGSKVGNFGIYAGYNSKSGLSSVSYHQTMKFEANYKSAKLKFNSGGSSRLSVAHSSYTPQVSMPMVNKNLSAKLKGGAAWWTVFGGPYLKGFYNEQWLANDGFRVPSEAYGYLNYQYSTGGRALLDFNREKDGVVRRVTPNLGIPVLTYDIYSATGQGISAMYRPMRNDVGIVHDPVTLTKSAGKSAGADVGPAVTHVGLNLTVNHAKSVSGPWSGENEMAAALNFQGKVMNDLFEPWHFKVHGEHSAEDVDELKKFGGTDPVRIAFSGDKAKPKALPTLLGNGQTYDVNNSSINRKRKPRSQVIYPITNDELLNNQEELVNLFKIEYYNHNNSLNKLIRDPQNYPGHHMAGYTAITPEGLQYVYGIPAYNKHQEEVVFSVDANTQKNIRVDVTNGPPQENQTDPHYKHPNTDQYLKKTELPPYAHSYLLTSIVGPDYVDLTGDGVSEDDLGYWVKFTYKKITSDNNQFKWRDPFSKAHYQEGFKTDPRDDKGSYVYGEKEIWYLAKAETKSHIAVFDTDERADAKGVAHRLQGSDNTGKSLHKLNQIQLYTRLAGPSHPIKVVKFDYEYSLCKEIPNGTANLGKLTLKKLWFEYGASTRGRLNPYIFTYNSFNPDYNYLAYDRWGNYKPFNPNDPLANVDFPYTSQDPDKKEDLDQYAAAWSLANIQLPSGGSVTIDYEVDDYAYVQNKAALQMTEIVDPYLPSEGTLSDNFELIDNNLKVRFKLETPISGTLNPTQQKEEVLKYLDVPGQQLYFKALMNIRREDHLKEYVSGYADINYEGNMGLEKDNNNLYRFGYFYLHSEKGHHPFSMRSWQHLRVNQPNLANIGKTMEQTDDPKKMVAQMKSVGSLGKQLREMFKGFYDYCEGEGFGKKMQGGKSWVRLSSPDKIKYGGGLRVRQITMHDQLGFDQEGYYGQVYEYTTIENGKTISSGVATFEPAIGGEENPLRVAKKYVESITLAADNNLFFEYPINEGQYPAPQVGYSKVKVASLAAAAMEGITLKNLPQNLFPKVAGGTIGTTGATIHEFYTAKDFPVRAEETEKKNEPHRFFVPIPLLGQITVENLTTSQGYSVITNDMHGKQKLVENYRQDRSGKLEVSPMSWVKYNYLQDTVIYQREKVLTLKNVFRDNLDETLSVAEETDILNQSIKKFYLGQESEFFMDMRENEDKAWDGGVNLNTDVVVIPFIGALPIPVPWPNIGKSTKRLRTAVTNKIIFQSGILASVEAYDGGSLVKTENLKWDKLTGVPVLTSVNNNFDAPVFSYSIPAFRQYQGMGAAYQNIGYTFNIKNVDNLPYHDNYYQFTTGTSEGPLFPGDELLLYANESEFKTPLAKVTFVGKENGDYLIYSSVPLDEPDYKAMIIRSGYRNQLSVHAGSITALEDPSEKGIEVSFEKTIKIPYDN